MPYEEKTIHWELVRNNETHRIFVLRVNQEMKAQDLSDNELASRCCDKGFLIGQSSVSRITGGRQKPTIAKIHAMSRGLGKEPWELFKLLTTARPSKTPKIAALPQPEKIGMSMNPSSGKESRLSKHRRRKPKGG